MAKHMKILTLTNLPLFVHLRTSDWLESAEVDYSVGQETGILVDVIWCLRDL